MAGKSKNAGKWRIMQQYNHNHVYCVGKVNIFRYVCGLANSKVLNINEKLIW